MAERDRFELDLAAALRAYLEEAPTEVRPTELARHFATAYPHGTATFGSWRFAALPRLAWALLLAGLLAALVGGTLLVGSQLQRRLPAVVPPVGQVYECPPGSNPDKPGPVDQARPADEYSAAAFDRRAGRLVVVTISGDGVETWTFDVCTNTWAQMHPDREPPRFDWAILHYDIDSDATLWVSEDVISGVTSGKVWAYDLQTDTWTEKRAAPTSGIRSLAYDPVSGLVVAAVNSATWEYPDRAELWTYDVETDTWAPIDRVDELGYAAIAYDASVDRLVAYGDQTWLFDIRSGTWSTSAAKRPDVAGWGGPELVYDEVAERTVVFMQTPLTAYDASTDRWAILAAADAVSPTLMAYDSANRRLVGWGSGGWGLPEGAVEALDLATGEWTVLLEPGGPPPSTPAPRPAPTSARTATPSEGPEETDSASPVPTASPTSTP